MHWILQENIFKEEAYDKFVAALARYDMRYSVHKVVPFVGELVPEPVLHDNNVICMGSYSMRHYAKKKGWVPGVFDLEPFNFKIQLEHWGDHMLNADSLVCRFEDASFTDELMFVRPIEDSKVFAGAVFTKDEFETWQKKVVVLEEDYGTSLTKDTLIQLSEPKVIHAEYRFWVVKGEIVTASLYKRGDLVIYSKHVDERFYDFVHERIAEWQPAAAFVIDVCETENGLKVVEIGTLNSCGFYAADLQRLVLALHDGFSLE